MNRLMFPFDSFKWYSAYAIITDNSEQASLALDAAKIKRSGFRFDQNVGIVGKEYIDVLNKGVGMKLPQITGH